MKRFSFFLGIFISVAFIFYALLKMDLRKAFSLLFEVKLYGFVLFVLAQYSSIFLRALCWSNLLDSIKSVSLFNLFKGESIGDFSNKIFPARLGELIRTYVISKQEGIKFSGVLATVVVQRALDLLNIAIITLVTLLTAKPVSMSSSLLEAIQLNAIILIILSVVIFSAGYYYSLKESKLNKVLKKFGNIIPESVVKKFEPLAHSFREGLNSLKTPLKLFKSFLFSLLMWWGTLLTLYATLLMFSLDANIKISAVMTVALAFGKLIPSGPGHIGPIQASLVFALGLYGVDPNIALGFAIGYHITAFIGSVIVAVFSLWSNGMSLSKIKLSATKFNT